MSTITVEKISSPQDQDPSIEVRKAFATADSKTKRDIAKTVFGTIVDNLSDEDLEKYNVIGDDLDSRFKAHEAKELTATEKDVRSDTNDQLAGIELDQSVEIGAPTGFVSTKEAEQRISETNPTALSLSQLARMQLGLPASFLGGRKFKLFGKNRKAYADMTPEEQEASRIKSGKYSSIVAAGAAGLTIAYGIAHWYMTKEVAAIDPSTFNTSHGDMKLSNMTVAPGPNADPNVGGSGGGAHNILPSSSNNLDVSTFSYNPTEDPALSALKHGNDFGPELMASSNDGQLPAGFSEMVDNRWKNSPGEFSAVLSKFGLNGNDAASINRLADQMAADPKLFQAKYKELTDLMNQPGVSITQEKITGPYGSYYAVNNHNGTATIAYDNSVDHGGDMIVVKTPQGIGRFRVQCGGQPIDLLPSHSAAPVYNQPTHYTPQGGGSQQQHFVSNPAPRQTAVPQTPSTPSIPETPMVPEVPVVPDIPPELLPKGNEYPDHPNLTNDLGPGEFMPTPAPVQTHVETQTGRDIGGGKLESIIHDAITNSQGSQTGARDNSPGVTHGAGQDTSRNPGSGSGVESGSAADSNNSGTAESR